MVHGSPSSAPPRQPTPSQNPTNSTTQQPLPSPTSQSAQNAQAPSQQASQPADATNGATAQNGRASPTAAVAGQDLQTEEGARGEAAGGRPQDIPHAKLVGTGGFAGEDMRALRVLDRKFCI